MSDFGFRSLVGYQVEPTGPDTAHSLLTVTEDHLNRGGILHGGAIATICDSAMGHAVARSLRPGRSAATVAMNVSFLSAASVGDELECKAKVRKPGKRVIQVEAVITRASDSREIATASATFAVRAHPDD